MCHLTQHESLLVSNQNLPEMMPYCGKFSMGKIYVKVSPDPPEEVFICAEHEPLKPYPYQIVATLLPLTEYHVCQFPRVLYCT